MFWQQSRAHLAMAFALVGIVWLAAVQPAAGAAPGQGQRVRVDVNTGLVTGCCTSPRTELNISWRAPDGSDKRTMKVQTAADGYYEALPGTEIGAGDVVAVFFNAGDPRLVPIHRLTGIPDEAADVVSGLAPPGAAVTVQVSQRTGAAVERRAVADAAGRYSASFAGVLDVVPGHGGALVAQLPGGDELVGAWVAQSLVVTLGTLDTVEGLAPYDLMPQSQLLNEDDLRVATGVDPTWLRWALGGLKPDGRAGGEVYSWYAPIRDAFGSDTVTRAGDVVQVQSPDGNVTRWTLPPLDATVFVKEDRVSGLARPNRAVTLTVNAESHWRARRTIVTTLADASGRFAFDLAGSFDLLYQDTLLLEVGDPGRVLRRWVTSPGLTLDLDTGSLTGGWAPGSRLAVTVATAGRERFRGLVWSDDEGTFTARIVDAADTPLALAAGDMVTVESVGQPTTESVSLAVPELDAVLDPANDLVSGRATPGGELFVFLPIDALYRPGLDPRAGENFGFAPIAADGSWSFASAPKVLDPGSIAKLTYRLPVGHLVTMRRAAPLLAAEVGGARSCGFAAKARQPVSAELRTAGGALAAGAAGIADAMSVFELVWRQGGAGGTGGTVVTAQPGQVARAQLGGAAAISVPLASLAATMDWRTYDLAVQGPPNLTAAVRMGLLPACQELLGSLDVRYLGLDGSGSGKIQTLPRPDQKAPGSGVVLFVYLPDGQLLFRHLPRPSAYLYVGTDRVTGWAEAGQPVTVAQLAADGTENGRATTAATEVGRFDARLQASGRSARLQAGRTVRLTAGGLTEDVKLGALDLDWSPGGPVIGRSDPGAAVELQLVLSDGRHLSIPRPADSAGRFGFAALDVPPRAGWGLGDVVAVRALVPVMGWHRLVVETPGFDAPRTRPPDVRGEHALFLPLVRQGRR